MQDGTPQSWTCLHQIIGSPIIEDADAKNILIRLRLKFFQWQATLVAPSVEVIAKELRSLDQ